MFMRKLYYRRQEPTTIVRKEELLTDKSDDSVGHFNTILARGGGNIRNQFKRPRFALLGGYSSFELSGALCTYQRAFPGVEPGDTPEAHRGLVRDWGIMVLFSSRGVGGLEGIQSLCGYPRYCPTRLCCVWTSCEKLIIMGPKQVLYEKYRVLLYIACFSYSNKFFTMPIYKANRDKRKSGVANNFEDFALKGETRLIICRILYSKPSELNLRANQKS